MHSNIKMVAYKKNLLATEQLGYVMPLTSADVIISI